MEIAIWIKIYRTEAIPTARKMVQHAYSLFESITKKLYCVVPGRSSIVVISWMCRLELGNWNSRYTWAHIQCQRWNRNKHEHSSRKLDMQYAWYAKGDNHETLSLTKSFLRRYNTHKWQASQVLNFVEPDLVEMCWAQELIN